MRKRYVSLAIAFTSLAALGVIGALTGGSPPSQQSDTAAPWVSAESTPPVPAPITDAPAPAASPEEAAGDFAGAKNPATGCGKPAPCPNRDCADCPHNIYLK